MTKEQLDVIVGLIAGTQAGVIALVGALKKTGAIQDIEAIAGEMERAGAAVDVGVRNRELIQMALRHIATGLRDPRLNPAEEISRLLH